MARDLFIVTGTTKGLGAAIVEALADENDTAIVCVSRFGAPVAPETKVPTQSGLWGKNGRNAAFHADFGNHASVEQAITQLDAHLRLSLLAKESFARAVLINNAGVVLPVGRFDTLAAADIERNLMVNVASPMALCAWFARASRELAAERLVMNISSGAAKRAIAGWSAYCTAKAGLEMATRVAAVEAASDDPTLTICSLAPGVVDTPMQTTVRSQPESAFPDVERFRTMKADGSLRPPADVARDIISLCRKPTFIQLARQEINLDIRNLHDL